MYFQKYANGGGGEVEARCCCCSVQSNHEQIYFHPMQNGPKHSNVVSSGVSSVVVTDVVVTVVNVVSGNTCPPCTAAVDASSP